LYSAWLDGLWNEDDFKGSIASTSHVECFFPFVKCEFMGDDTLGCKLAFGDPINDRLKAVGAEMGTKQVEFLAVANDAPVDGRRGAKD